jgi:hypothetical protein
MARSSQPQDYVTLDNRGGLDLLTKHGVILHVEVSEDAIVDVPQKGKCLCSRNPMIRVMWGKGLRYEKGSMLLSKADLLRRHQEAMVAEALDRLVKEGIMQYGNGCHRLVFESGANI